MDPFALAMIGLLVALILFLVVVGKFAPGSGLEELGLKSAREITERRAAADAEDVHQMLEARNARRRARGEREVTLEEMELKVMNELGEERRRREQYIAEHRAQQAADDDLDGLLEATNARRRARGLPERTREQARREFSPDGGLPTEE